MSIADIQCGGIHNSSGHLQSPMYPDAYPPAADCTYLISQPEGAYVNISVLFMDIVCQEIFKTSDFIEMRDGKFKDSPLMGRFCGNGSDVPAFLQTTQNHLTIR